MRDDEIVGTGNIVGASGAILTGGPGAIFWMWVIAFFGMATIYAEATLALTTRQVDKDGTIHGGPVYYITTAFKGGFGKFLAGFFAVAIILALGFMGCMVQSNSIGSTFETAFGTVFGSRFGAIFVAVCLFFFAFSTVLSWNLFGKINVIYLFGRENAKRSTAVYTVIALVFIFAGTMMSNDLVWELTDLFNNLMVLPNALALFALTGTVAAIAKNKTKAQR